MNIDNINELEEIGLKIKVCGKLIQLALDDNLDKNYQDYAGILFEDILYRYGDNIISIAESECHRQKKNP